MVNAVWLTLLSVDSLEKNVLGGTSIQPMAGLGRATIPRFDRPSHNSSRVGFVGISRKRDFLTSILQTLLVNRI